MPMGWGIDPELAFKDWSLVNYEEEGCTQEKLLRYFKMNIFKSRAFLSSVYDIFPIRENIGIEE